jgi:DNA-binding response OmpR family regulator
MSRVLLVADEPWIQNEVRAALSQPGVDVTHHADPETAAVVVTEVRPDVVLVDLQVGSMGGMAVTRAIRQAEYQQGDGPAVPVVMLLDRRADAFLARRAGAAAWLQKPFGATELREAIDSAVAAGAEEESAE